MCLQIRKLEYPETRVWTHWAASDKRQMAALKFWRLGWCLGMGLGPIFKHHNVFQYNVDAATAAATWRLESKSTVSTAILTIMVE